MSSTSTSPPQKFTAGATVVWAVDAPDYPATTWTCLYELVSATHRTTGTGSASGTRHLITLSATNSVLIPPGTYAWRESVSKGSGSTLERYDLATGHVVVEPSFGTTGDFRSFSRKMLDLYETGMILRATNSPMVSSYQILNRSLTSYSDDELLANRDKFRAEVLREEQGERVAAGLGSRRIVYTRMP